jgi:trigger factor
MVAELLEKEYPVVQVTDLGHCHIKVYYEADPEVIASKTDEAITSVKDVKIPGFRKGKATPQALKSKLGPQIKQFVANALASNAIDDIIFETDVKIFGQPKFSNVKFDNKNFSCEVEIVSIPEFEVTNFKFEIPKPHQDLTEDELVEKSLLNLRKQFGNTRPYEETDTVESGDNITMSYTAMVGDESYAASEGQMYTVGSNRYPGFDDQIIGLTAGESKEFDLEIDGKTVSFDVDIHMGMRSEAHPIDAEFLEKCGAENIEEVLYHLRDISQRTMRTNEENKIKEQVIARLIENANIELPEVILKNTSADESSLKLSFILDAIREAEPDSVLSDVEAFEQIEKLAQSQGLSMDKVIRSREQIAQLVSVFKDNFTLNWLVSQSTIVE